MLIDLTALGSAIERAAARATVGEFGCDAVWISATAEGACLRASICLLEGYDPAEVADALRRWEDSTVSPC